MVLGNWISTCKRMNLDLYLTPYADSNIKWIIGLNVQAKTIKLLEENKQVFMTLNSAMVS